MALVSLLQTSKVSDVPKPKEMVTLLSTDNPRAAFERLAAANIRSAPVKDVRTNLYMGFLDIRDLVAFIVYENAEEDLRKAVAETGTTSEFVTRLLSVGAKMYDQPMEGVSLLFLARRHKFFAVDESATLDDVAKLLVHKGCHRVPVVNGAGEVVNVVSQSTIIKFLDANRAKLGAIGSHTVARAACGTSPVLSVRTTDTVLKALEVMAANDVMGVAVVDETGHLVANTSASDLKEFLRNPTTSLRLPVLDFISKVRQANLKTMHPAIHVGSGDSLGHVIGKLAAAKVHRLFVVDGGKLQSVLSLTDILKYSYLVSLLKGDD